MGGGRMFFTNERWARVAHTVAGLTRRGPKGDTRRFVEAVVWVLRSGAPWRDLSTRFGPWKRVYRRYRRWALAGRWETLRERLAEPRAGGLLLIDSTIVKAHPHAAGARKRGRVGQAAQALGRSRGGFTTKLHALVTERGELVRYCLTGGQVHDIRRARALVGRSRGSRAVVGDRAYDSDAFVEHIRAQGMRAVIPTRANRKTRRELDVSAYAQRNVIERWFGRMKTYRRVATRYDKTSRSYLGFVALAATLLALTGWSG